jgi:UDP-N-acetylglucosamine 2-epimerase (non-hydrolysing)
MHMFSKKSTSIFDSPATTPYGNFHHEEHVMPDLAGDARLPGVGPIRAMLVLGTGPEVVKLAPVIRAMTHLPAFEPIVVGTGQEALAPMLGLLGIEPRIDLSVEPIDLARSGERPRPSERTGRLVGELDQAIRTQRADLIIVRGDTTTALCGALAASYRKMPVAHVDAGLRARDAAFPEEINRRLIGRIARRHFAPTPRAAACLHAEGVPAERVVVTGDTGIDTLIWVLERRLGRSAFRKRGRRVLVALRHRQSAEQRGIALALRRLADRGDGEILLPVHPAVRESLLPEIGRHPHITITEPLGFADHAASLAACDLVLTDSGDVQEEAPALGKPVLVLRATTERPESVQAGVARLVGTDGDQVFAAASRLLDDPAEYARMAEAVNPFGEGQAARHILTELARDFARPRRRKRLHAAMAD